MVGQKRYVEGPEGRGCGHEARRGPGYAFDSSFQVGEGKIFTIISAPLELHISRQNPEECRAGGVNWEWEPRTWLCSELRLWPLSK